jgi:hypothetical protein
MKKAKHLPQHSSATSEWYTPALIVDCINEVWSRIDLDPASCEEANQRIRADRYFSVVEDGLAQKWDAGRLYLNSPYGFLTERPAWSHARKAGAGWSAKEVWLEKLDLEIRAGRTQEALVLTTASTGDVWFQRFIAMRASALCFPKRVQFEGQSAVKRGQPGSSVIAYFGSRANAWPFAAAFSKIGWVVLDWIRRLQT